MGEYWKPVNVTRREYVNPHRLGDGLKLSEWRDYYSDTMRRIEAIWPEDDDVRAVSDGGREQQLWGEPRNEGPHYDDLTELGYRDVSSAESQPPSSDQGAETSGSGSPGDRTA